MRQDGAGRIGKMLFARHGKKFDVDLKQVLHLPLFRLNNVLYSGSFSEVMILHSFI